MRTARRRRRRCTRAGSRGRSDRRLAVTARRHRLTTRRGGPRVTHTTSGPRPRRWPGPRASRASQAFGGRMLSTGHRTLYPIGRDTVDVHHIKPGVRMGSSQGCESASRYSLRYCSRSGRPLDDGPASTSTPPASPGEHRLSGQGRGRAVPARRLASWAGVRPSKSPMRAIDLQDPSRSPAGVSQAKGS